MLIRRPLPVPVTVQPEVRILSDLKMGMSIRRMDLLTSFVQINA